MAVNWAGKIAVVTGASAGIGAAVTLDLARAGLKVVGLARRKENIEELAKKNPGPGSIHAIACDVSSPKSIEAAFAEIKAKFGKVNILINNAGRMKSGSTLSEELASEELISTVNINVTGAVLCTREAYKLMKVHDEPGYIINVNSVAGHLSPTITGVAYGNVYGATKHALTHHTESVRLELASKQENRIRVTSLSPGLVKTEFQSAAGFGSNLFNVDQMPHLIAQDISDAVLYLLNLPANVNISELTIKPTGEQF
jgi:NADP+-dependent farnesol dehydrogenase